MLLVGLTGGIASGKTTVSAMLAERGAEVIDADHIARQVVLPGTPAWCKLRDHFGLHPQHPVAPAGDRAVEREADRVEHRRLAGPGRADQREEVGVGEVDRGRLAEHGEPGQVQAQRPHPPTS